MATHRKLVFVAAAAAAAVTFHGDRAANAGFCNFCGSNAATVGDGIVFDELHVQGATRPEHPVQLTSAYTIVDGQYREVRFRVQGGQVVAGPPNSSRDIYPMLGVTFLVRHTDGRAYQIQITKVCDGISNGNANGCVALNYAVDPPSPHPYYEFKVQKVQRRSRPGPDDRLPDACFDSFLCRGDLNDNKEIPEGLQHAGFLFAGDHYDKKRRRVESVKSGEGWFNLACLGTVPAKMDLLRLTNASSTATRTSKDSDRTAIFKMLSADYGGDGTTWTADGTKIQYVDRDGSWEVEGLKSMVETSPFQIEAVWGANGALCLGNPRRLAKATSTCECRYAGVTRAEVIRACRSAFGPTAARPEIPPCFDAATGKVHEAVTKWKNKTAGVYGITVNPIKQRDTPYCAAPPRCSSDPVSPTSATPLPRR
jgi:hypothetical protein